MMTHAEQPLPQTETKTKLQKLFDNPIFSLVYVLCALFVLPEYGAGVMMAACAAYLTAVLALFPDRLRGRKGSLKLAFWLIGFFWAMTLVAVFASLMN